MEKEKNNKYKLKLNCKIFFNYIRKNRFMTLLVLIAICFPYILWIVGKWKLYFVIEIYSDLLSYYGVLFGILSSFALYRAEQEKEGDKHRRDLRPQFFVELQKTEDGCFALIITNLGIEQLRSIYCEGDYVVSNVKTQHEIAVYKSDEECPNSIQICCDDREDNIWAFDFIKRNESDKPYYYLIDSYMI